MRYCITLWCLLLAGCETMHPTSMSIVGTGLSHHLIASQPNPYNEINQGLGLRLDMDQHTAVQSGFYRNSFGRNTDYLLLDYSPWQNHADSSCGHIQAGGFIAAATGYNHDTAVPMTGAQAAVSCGDLYVRARAFPAPVAGAVFSAELGWIVLRF
jgi:hypothetical protein